MELLDEDGVSQLKALADRDVSARQLLEAVVARTDQWGRKLNAVISRDLDRARAQADQIDDQRARRGETGRLAACR